MVQTFLYVLLALDQLLLLPLLELLEQIVLASLGELSQLEVYNLALQ
jgi:hypothetical protein